VSRPKLARPALLLVVAAGALPIAGCSHAVYARAGATVQVALTEYRLRPNRVAAVAGTITLVARNFGRLTHNLVVSNGAQKLGSTPPIPPGGSATLKVTLRPGTYEMASTMLSDQDLGQFGTLLVKR